VTTVPSFHTIVNKIEKSRKERVALVTSTPTPSSSMKRDAFRLGREKELTPEKIIAWRRKGR
jgi:hypothetical protein